MFLTGASRAGSEFTPASSRAPSECGSNDNYGTAYNNLNASQPEPRSSQLRHFAIATEPEDPDSPPPRQVGLRRAQSFHQLPLSLLPVHTIEGISEGAGAEPTFEINEMSPDEDERLVESALRNETEGEYYYSGLRVLTIVCI